MTAFLFKFFYVISFKHCLLIMNLYITSYICPHLDEDECQMAFLDSCPSLADCVNTQGSFKCVCMPGLTGENGQDCTGEHLEIIR